jgi:hypothetical protein
MHRSALRVRLIAGLSTLAFASSLHAAIHTYKFPLEGSQEVPPVPTSATGFARVMLNDVSGAVTVDGAYSGLTSTASAAHIHIGAPGVNGGVILALGITGGTSGSITGSGTLSAANVNAMLAGNTYVNLHTSNFPGGEIRGQIVDAIPHVHTYEFPLSGDQEVPPVPTPGHGEATVVLNEVSREVTVDGTFADLTANASAAHIHIGAPGVNGGVIVTLSVPPATSGTITGSGTLSAANRDAMLDGNTYINVHTSNFPGGEIRGQIVSAPAPKCPADLNGDNVVDVFDLLGLLAAWGPCPGCDADLNGDDVVDVFDLLALLAAWGPCP